MLCKYSVDCPIQNDQALLKPIKKIPFFPASSYVFRSRLVIWAGHVGGTTKFFFFCSDPGRFLFVTAVASTELYSADGG